MKWTRMTFMAILLSVVTGCARLGMNPPQTLNIQGIQPHPYNVGLFIPKDLQEYIYVAPGYLEYPLGEQTTAMFRKNLPIAFKSVQDVDSLNPAQQVKLILQPSIVNFNSVIPYPAWNPYTATMIYRIDVYDRKGEKIYTQTATGEAQTSKGLLSGFVARRIVAEVAQTAMDNAMKQIIEGLASAEELKESN